MPNYTGTEGNDTHTGTSDAETILGLGGNDSLSGAGGNDEVDGGAGDDILNGNDGDDTILGGDGNDQLRGGSGDDQMDGGAGNDLLRGNIGIDGYVGGTGGETWGSGYGDRISFYDAAATAGVVADLRTGVITNDGFGNVEAMSGIESLGGDTAFVDTFYGNDSSNFFQANRGDLLYGFGGTDAFSISSAAAVVDGGDGDDVLWLNVLGDWLLPDSNGDGFAELSPAATSGWNVNLATGGVIDGFGNIGSVTAIEYVSGSSLHDTITGSGNADNLAGDVGNDTISGGAGNDIISGDGVFDFVDGVITLVASSLPAPGGNDTLNGNDGNDTIFGGDGNDQLRGGSGDDQMDGGAGNDLLRGNIGIDGYVGGTGGETWGSGYGDRISFYDAAATAGVVADLRTGVITNDGFGNVEAMSGIESLGGDTAFVDTFYGNDSSNFFQANRGDLLYGFGGTDGFSMASAVGVVDGGDGIDVLWLDLAGDWLMPDSNGDGQAELAPAGTSGWSINLATGAMTDGFGNAGTVIAIEYVSGSGLHDTITGSDFINNNLAGNVGNDTLNGGLGNDILSGDGVFEFIDGVITLTGSTLAGPSGNDILNGGGGNDTLYGGGGNDQIDGGSGQDQSFGDDGDDTLIISAAPVNGDIYNGGDGTDTLRFLTTAGTLNNTTNGPVYQINMLSASVVSIERLEFMSLEGSGLTVVFNAAQVAGLSSTAELVGGAGTDNLVMTVTVGGTYTIQSFIYSNWTFADEAFEAGDIITLAGGGNADFTLNAAQGHLGYQSLVSGGGNDTLNGTDGMEVLNGGGGVNTLNAGGGDDILIAQNFTPLGGAYTNRNFAGNVFNGGAGFDWLSVGGFVEFQGELNSIEGINFLPASSIGGAIQTEAELAVDLDRFDSIPPSLNLRGTGTLSLHLAAGDVIDASGWVHTAGSNVFVQFFGSDEGGETVVGTSGNDRFSPSFGTGTFTGGAGNDQFEAGEGQVTVTDFTIGQDRVDLQDMNITSFAQLLPYLSQVGANVVFSRMYGGVAQTMTLLNVNLAQLSAADFIFQTGNDGDTRIGTDAADDLIGAFGADHLEGRGGNDYLFAGAGEDELLGGDGNDMLLGGANADLMSGGAGDDIFQDTAADFNGDTITDFAAGDSIVFIDANLATFTFSLSGSTLTYAGGTLTLQGVTGTLVASAAEGGGVQLTLETATPDVRNDFNGDGRSDILWRYVDGTIGNWLANEDGTHTTNGPSVTPAPGSWNIAGTGDFDGDGRDDILWRSNAGEVGSWAANADGSHSYNAAAGVTVIPLSWQVEAVGDFNADGKDDILWRNTDGTVGVWSGQTGGSFVANNAAVFNVSTDWQIVGTGDFNGDGKDDILWRHDSGTFADWLANDDGGFTPNNPSLVAISSDWHIIGTGDFNGDGRDDILWRHDSGTVANWTANPDGTFSPNFASLVTITNDWSVASIGDYNGDGRDDILWRHDSGTVANWLANTDNSGTFTTNQASFAGIPNEWQVQDPAVLVL